MPNRRSSDDGATRSFCGQCGSPIAFESSDRPDIVHLQPGLFDDLESLQPIDHSFRNEKPRWQHADEHLPSSSWSG